MHVCHREIFLSGPIDGSHNKACPDRGRDSVPCPGSCHQRHALRQPGRQDPGRELLPAGRGGLAIWADRQVMGDGGQVSAVLSFFFNFVYLDQSRNAPIQNYGGIGLGHDLFALLIVTSATLE